MSHWNPLFKGLRRRWVLLGFLFLMGLCLWHLGTDLVSLGVGADPWSVMKAFFGAALSPTLADQSPSLPPEAAPFWQRLIVDLLTTVRYALIAMSLAVPMGLLLGFFASSTWWTATNEKKKSLRLLLGVKVMIRWGCRLVIAFMRSIHELIWALFFLSALGDAPIVACLALAMPFAGTLGKVFSEFIEEQGRKQRAAIGGLGASPWQTFFLATLPQVWPNFCTYTLYRFECALRSSAVLGFIGIETIGLTISRSFENLYFREVWTELYVLGTVILAVDGLGYWVRSRWLRGPLRREAAPTNDEPSLRKKAPKDRPLRSVLWLIPLSALGAWFLGSPILGNSNVEPAERLSRFFSKLTPEPIRPQNGLANFSERWESFTNGWSEFLPWIHSLWQDPGREALLNTLSLATMAILLAGLGALIILPWATRSLAQAKPYEIQLSPRRTGRLRKILGFFARLSFLLARAIPEYIYAFLLVSLLGPSAWPLVLALALHNYGILGRLWGEVLENLDPRQARQAFALGANRKQVYLFSILPNVFNRFILFFFYRWETCIREAMVLGMLGISSLGYHISIARNFLRYDEMLFFVILGATVIILGDFFSDWLRRRLR